jgi:ferredoxin
MKHIVYFYSGTGNSLAVAKKLEDAGADVHSISFEYQKMQESQENHIICKASKIGFVIPTYYLGLPRIVHEFIKALDIRNADYIYVVATMGGNIKGGIIRQIKALIKEKNYALDMGCYVQMPMNDFTFAKVDEPDRQKILLEKSEKRIQDVVKIVQIEKKHFDFEPLGFMAKKRNAPFCENARTSDYKFSVTEACTGCDICSGMCSTGNIKIIDKRPQWQHGCQMCLACFHSCPEQAILYDGKGKGIPHYHHPNYSLAEKVKYTK